MDKPSTYEPFEDYINHYSCCYGQIADKKQLKGKTVYLGLQFGDGISNRGVASHIILQSGSRKPRGNWARL